MVGDAFWVNVAYDKLQDFDAEELSRKKAQEFYQLLKEINTSLLGGSSDFRLRMCVRLLTAKSNWNVHDQCLDFFAKMILNVTLVKENTYVSFYDVKRMV